MRVKKDEKKKLDDSRTKTVCGTEIIETSVADPGSLSRILIFINPGSRIQQQQKRERGKFVVLPFLVSTNVTYFKIILFLNW